MKKIILLFFTSLFFVSCGYKKSVGDTIYVQFCKVGNATIPVAHSNPNCPELKSYHPMKLSDCYAVEVCAKCVKEDDVSKILKK